MTFDLSNYENSKAYFGELADKSKHVQGFLHGDIEIAQEEASGWQGIKLWSWPATKGRIDDRGSDNILLNREGVIWIGGPCESEEHNAEDTFYKNCELVMKKVVAKMIQDNRECKISVTFNQNTFDRAETFAGATRLIGCEYRFSMLDPDGFEYDENDWTF